MVHISQYNSLCSEIKRGNTYNEINQSWETIFLISTSKKISTSIYDFFYFKKLRKLGIKGNLLNLVKVVLKNLQKGVLFLGGRNRYVFPTLPAKYSQKPQALYIKQT